MTIYETRWHVTNIMFRAGLVIAPRGAAKDLLVKSLEEYSDHIIASVEARK